MDYCKTYGPVDESKAVCVYFHLLARQEIAYLAACR